METGLIKIANTQTVTYCHENQDCISEIELIEVDEDWVGEYGGNGQGNLAEITEFESFQNLQNSYDDEDLIESARDESGLFIQLEKIGTSE